MVLKAGPFLSAFPYFPLYFTAFFAASFADIFSHFPASVISSAKMCKMSQVLLNSIFGPAAQLGEQMVLKAGPF